MEEKLIIRISNSLGNQMFMYAAGYATSKIMNRTLYYDHISAYKSRKNISEFIIDNFQLIHDPVTKDNLFIGLPGYLKRKIMKKLDNLKTYKSFILENKDSKKETYYDKDFLKNKYSKTIYMEGYFETEKYFLPYKKEIIKQFVPKNINIYKNNKYLLKISNSQSVALCIRGNRFTEKTGNIDEKDRISSEIFVKEQIDYIKKAISFFKKTLNKPIFYLWSNIQELPNDFSFENIIHINNNDIADKKDKILCDFFLMTNCKHYVVTPSSFNWWGCWLSKSEDSIVLRPSDNYFSKINIKNKDYWPKNWKEF